MIPTLHLRLPGRAPALVLVLALALLPGGAWAKSPVGLYRAAEGPDVAAWLEISADGRFRYTLAAGALDEGAEGRWREERGETKLYTEPKPRPPEFRIAARTPTADAPFLRVVWPDGRGIPGVDFRIGFAAGEPLTGYTQEDGWSLPAEERRRPLWVEFHEPIHGFASGRFTLPPQGTSIVVGATLVPNDLGIVDFQGAPVTLDGEMLILHRAGGDMRFVRAVSP